MTIVYVQKNSKKLVVRKGSKVEFRPNGITILQGGSVLDKVEYSEVSDLQILD